MSFLIQSLSAGNKEQEFRERYPRHFFLGSDHEGVTERYSIESDSGELEFGLGVSTAITSVKPKALLLKMHRTLFVGFDSFVGAVPIVNQSSMSVSHQLLRLDGVFVDMFLLSDEKVCVIHELGALVVTPALDKVWSVSTDVLSDWEINEEQSVLSLTEADSGGIVRFSVSTGAALAA